MNIIKLEQVHPCEIRIHESKKYYKCTFPRESRELIQSKQLQIDKGGVWIEIPPTFSWIFQAYVDIEIIKMSDQIPVIAKVTNYFHFHTCCGKIVGFSSKCGCAK